jgi:hypothetical protein
MECKKGEGEGEISYHGTTYDGFIKMKMVEEGQTMTMNTKLAGIYLGPCPKGQKSGPTGETAKQVAVANQAVAQGKQQQAQLEASLAANAKRRGAHQAEVSDGGRGACAQEASGERRMRGR